MTLLPERRLPPPARSDAQSLSEDDEVRLIARTAAGDLRAFELLYRLYHPRLTRFLERMTRRPGLVEEVLDDTLMVVWRRADTFKGDSKLSTWIFAIAYRKALKALRRLDYPAVDESADERPEPGPGPEQRFGEGELRSALLAALTQLSAPQRAVVDLAYFQGLGVREIAEIADCPVDTVKTRMFYARRRLQGRCSPPCGRAGDDGRSRLDPEGHAKVQALLPVVRDRPARCRSSTPRSRRISMAARAAAPSSRSSASCTRRRRRRRQRPTSTARGCRCGPGASMPVPAVPAAAGGGWWRWAFALQFAVIAAMAASLLLCRPHADRRPLPRPRRARQRRQRRRRLPPRRPPRRRSAPRCATPTPAWSAARPRPTPTC